MMKNVIALLGVVFVLTGCASGSAFFGKGSLHFPMQREATGKNTFVFSPKAMAWAAYDPSGKRVRTGRASGGVDKCPESPNQECRTVTGHFQVLRKGDETCESKTYPIGEGGAPMPHCMFFNGGYAIHGSHEVPDYHASHGCIRVKPAAARWLNEEFLSIGSTVVVNSY